MKKWKLPVFWLFILACVLVNFGGRALAKAWSLPFWLDSVGTVLCAYLAGPICGAIVGVTGNLIWSLMERTSWVYGLISLAIGVIVGLAAKRGSLRSLLGTLTVSMMVAMVALIVSVPLNWFFEGGSTGNLWGDAVSGFLQEQGIPLLPAMIVGQFYVEVLDKLLTLVLMFAAVRGIRWILRRCGHSLPEHIAPMGEKAAALLLALSLLGCAIHPSAARAEEAQDYNNYVHTIYSSKNGLPCGEANDIAQTSDGILWIGTYAGLYRYNGQEFRWMDHYDTVRNVNCLYTDAEGRLWIGTNDNGLAIAIQEEIMNVVDQDGGLPSNSVRSIIQSTDGYYYVGTTSSMQIITLSGGLRLLNSLWEVNYADDVAADDRGHVAAVTSDGKLFLLQGGQILSSRQLVDRHTVFKTCAFDPEGHLLAGTTGNEIFVFDISSGGFTLLETLRCSGLSSLKDISFLESGEMFISADNGIGYFSPDGTFELINTNDFNNSIDNMLVDYQGNLWFTSSRLGLLRMAPSNFQDIYSMAGMSNRVVNTIARWQGDYYIGTDKGLDVVDSSLKRQITNAWTKLLQSMRIRCMITDTSDHLWVCTYGSGLMEFSPTGERWVYNQENGGFGNRARVVTQLRDGTILAAGDTGISFIRDQQITQTIRYADGLINSMILTLTEMEDGRILAGTDGNGIAVLENGAVSRMLTRSNGLSSEVILRTVSDPTGGGVFIVTSNGLCYMEADESVRTLDNFPYFNNYDIWIQDGEKLFVMSSAGLYVVDRQELLSGTEELSYELLDSNRGLNSSLTANSWSYLNTEGLLFLPCDTGVFALDTEHFTATVRAYRMNMADVRLDGESHRLDQGNTLRIGRTISRLELFPEVINYTIQDPFVGYWLEGFDTEWTILPLASLSSIVYTNLPAGEYALHLAIYDTNQEQVLAERTYTLVKERQLYDHPWFIVYMLLVPMLAVGWVTWLFVRRREERIEKELAIANREVEMGRQTIVAIAKAVDAKDERTSQHSARVAQYSEMIAREAGLSEEDCKSIFRTAQMHDIGKIGIPDNILNKPARLTDDEYAVMKSHTVRGAEILQDFTLLDHVIEGAKYHHERYDGKGYPSGLAGEDIPLYARIIGVADAFDAMTANRVYRKQMDFDYVLGELERGRGTQFDPQFVDILLKLIHDGKIDLNELYGTGQTTDGDSASQAGSEKAGGDPA